MAEADLMQLISQSISRKPVSLFDSVLLTALVERLTALVATHAVATSSSDDTASTHVVPEENVTRMHVIRRRFPHPWFDLLVLQALRSDEKRRQVSCISLLRVSAEHADINSVPVPTFAGVVQRGHCPLSVASRVLERPKSRPWTGRHRGPLLSAAIHSSSRRGPGT